MEAGSGLNQAAPSDSSRWVPIREAARLLGVSIDTIRRWDEKGIIHSNRLKGRNRYFDVAELEHVKASQPLTISEAALQLGVSATTLRRLEKEGVVTPQRSESGERLYTPELLTVYAKAIADREKTRKTHSLVSLPSAEAKTVHRPGPWLQRVRQNLFGYPAWGAAAAVVILLALVALGKSSPDQGKSHISFTRGNTGLSSQQRGDQSSPESSQEEKSSQEANGKGPQDSASSLGKVAGIVAGITNLTLENIYDSQPGIERAMTANDKDGGLSFDIYQPAEYLYIDLREDGTKFVVRDHGHDTLTINSNKNIIAHDGSKLEIQGTLTLDGEAGDANQVLTSQGQGQTPVWKSFGDVSVGDVNCTDCLNEEQIEDIYVLNTGDEVGGNLTLTGQSDLRFAAPGSTNYVGFQAPTDISASLIWTLPSSDGTANQVLKTNGSGQLSWTSSGGGSFTSFTLAGDTGTSQTIEDGNTLSILTDSNLTATAGATDTVTVSIDADAIDGSELADSIILDAATLTFTDGTNTLLTLTDSGATGNLSLTGDLTISGDDLVMGTNTSGFILVADGTNFNPVAVSGHGSLASNGALTISDITCTDCLNATEIEDIYLLNTGDTATGSYTFTQGAGEKLLIDASTTAHTDTAGALDINVGAGNAAVDGINLAFTVNDGATAATDFEGEAITLTANDADADVFGLTITSAATTNAGAGSYEALIRLSNAEDTAGAVTDAILITTSSGTAGDIVDAIDASAADITNALNVGANTITGTSYTIDASGDLAVGSSGTDTITLATDGTGNAEVVLPTGAIGSTEILDGDLLEADLKAVDAAVDEECLTFETTTGDFEWQGCDGTITLQTAYGNDADGSNSIISLTSADDAVVIQNDDATNDSAFSFMVDQNDTAGVDAVVIDSESTDSNAILITHAGDGIDNAAAAAISVTAESGAGGLYVTRNLGAGEDAPLVEIFQDNLAGDQTALYVRQDSQTAVALEIDSTATTGDIFDVTTTTLTTGNVAELNTGGAALTSGRGLAVFANPQASTLANRSGELILFQSNRIDVGAASTISDDYDVLRLSRGNVLQGSGTGGTFAAAGSVLKIENIATQTLGTLTDTVALLELVQDADSTGAVILATNPGTSAFLNLTASGAVTTADGILIANSTTGVITDAIDVSDAEIVNALNVGANTITGTSYSVDASGTLTLGSSGLDALVVTTDGTGNDEVQLPTGSISSAEILDGDLLEADLKAVDAAVDEECLTFETTTGDFEWQSCGSASVAADSLDFIDFEDTLDVDANTVINLGTANLDINMDSTGEFAIQDGGADILHFADDTGIITASDDVDFSLAGSENVTITNATASSDLLVLTPTTTSNTVDGLYINYTNTGGTSNTGARIEVNNLDDAGADAVAGLYIDFENEDAGDTTYGIHVANTDVTNADVSAFVLLENLSETTNTVADGLLIIDNSTGGAITDAIDVSDEPITNAINVGANTIAGTTAAIDLTDFDVSADGLIVLASDSAGDQISVTAPAGDHQILVADATTNDNTSTAGLIDLNIDAGNAAVDGINIDLESIDGVTAATDQTAIEVLLSASDADADMFGLVINAAATANAAAGSYEAALKIDNAEDTAGSMPDAIIITATTDTATTDAIDVSDAELVNALNVGANTITGTSYSVDASGTLTLGSSGLDALVVTTDGTGNDEVQLPTGAIGSTEILDGDLLEADLKAVDAAADEECLTFESTAGDFEWQSCSGSSTTLQGAYDADVDGGNAIISLTSADDAVVIQNDNATNDSAFAFFIDQNDTAGVDALNIDSESTDSNAISITHQGDASTNTAAAIEITAESGAGGLFVTRNLGAAEDDALVEILADHASGDQPALLIDNDATAGLAFSIVADNTTGDVVDISAAALTQANAIDIPDLNVLTTGKGLSIASGSEAITSGELLTLALTSSGSANSAKTGALASIAASRTDTRVSGTTADDYDLLGLTRTSIQNGAGGTTTAAGSVLRIENIATQTAGTLTDTTALLEMVQDPDSTGKIITVSDGTRTTLEVKHTSARFGAAANAGAFIDRMGYFGWEFTNDGTDVTADINAAGGTSAQISYLNQAGMYESTASGCTFSIADNGDSGRYNMSADAAAVGCLTTADRAAGTPSQIIDPDNLPVMIFKVRPTAADSTSGIYIGIADSTDGVTAAPSNFIGFSNDNAGTLGASWVGIARAAGTSTTVTCTGATVNTTTFNTLMVEVRSTSNARFFYDVDASDGIHFTECDAAATTNITSTGLAPQIHWQERTGGAASSLDIDYYRVWQDDAPNSEVAGAQSLDVKKVEAELNSQSSLAEFFPSDDLNLAPGTVVSLQADQGSKANPTSKAYDQALLGVVADNAGLTLGANGTFDGLPVATHGRARVRVSTQNGPIQPGDYLTSSNTSGVAMKANHAGQAIGMALEPLTSDEGFVLTEIKPQFWAGGTLTEFLTREGKSFDLEEDGEALSSLLVDAKAFAEQDAKLVALVARVDEVEKNVSALKEGTVASAVTSNEQSVTSNSDDSSLPTAPREALREVGLRITPEALQIEGNAEVLGELSVRSDVTLYANLIVDTVHIASALNVHGDTTLFGNLNVKGDAAFEGEITLGQNQAGLATIPRGGKEVEVLFTKPFLNDPIVNITALGNAKNYWVSQSEKTGFTIAFEDIAQEEVTFTWTALTVKEPTPTIGKVVDENENGIADIDEPTPTFTPSEVEGPTPTPAPQEGGTGAGPTPTPTPTVEITPSPEILPSFLPNTISTL